MLFGVNGIIASHISLGSVQIVLLRTLAGGLLLGAVFFATGKKPAFPTHKRETVYICISGIAMGCSWMLLYEAYRQIGVSIATLLYYCGPVIVMVLSPILFKERLNPVKIAGFITVLAGVLLINGSTSDTRGNPFGVFCGLASAATYVVMVAANKKAVHIQGTENCVIQLASAFLTVAVFAMFRGELFFRINPRELVWILLLGLVNTGIGCWLYFSSIGRLPVQSVAILGYSEPLSAVLFSVLFLGEKMLPLQIVGAVLIIGGALLGESAVFKGRKNRQAHTDAQT